ncbi:mesoderm posterior protein 1-like, partial [Schistocerca serialis cubense]|uniref:mesoderm posterior protein 1-like n=1 Tax=Schistocerca serialis cubense TaxID=2023355 RepID=UPI00214DF78B
RARRRQPQPLSRYRRRTANARERERMREINAAFEALRRALPPLAAPAAPESDDDDASEEQQRAGEKVTKVATLRLAIRYITELTRALETVSYSPPSPALLPAPCGQQQEVFSVPYSALQTQQLPPPQQQQQTVGEAAALQLGVSAAVSLPPVSTLILPQSAPCGGFFASDAAAGCEQLLTPPPSLTPSSSLGADCVAPALDDTWPPPDLCLTPPPLLDDAFLAPR